MPAYQNNTATLADIVSPGYAAYQAGIENSNANEAAQLENQKAQALLPYAAPGAAADIGYKNAQTGLVGQESQAQGLKNLFTQQTQPGEIKATNAESANKYTAQQAQSIGLVGQIAGQLAGQLDSIPEAGRRGFMLDYLQSKGLNPSDFGPLANGDPDQLRQFSQKAIQASANYQTELMKEGSQTERTLGAAQISSEGRVSAAELQASARRQVAQIQQQTRQQSQTFEQAAVQAERSGDHGLADKYRAAAQQIRQLGAQTTASLVGQNPNAPVFSGGDTGAPAPAAPQQAAQPTVPASDGQFEYRIGPDGNIQRRAIKK